MTNYCYVIDKSKKPLEPTNYNNGWRLIRKKKATLVSMYPFVIKLEREIETSEANFNVCGIDTGSKFTGIAVVSECKTMNKVLFKGTINHRQDVSKLMELRKGQRRYRRSHKRYREVRFDNRASSKTKGRIPPTIKTNKDEILRTINQLSKFLNIHKVVVEDVAIDIRKLQDGDIYKWQYQKSNRLDENIRKATIIRDKNRCMECGKFNCKLEVHHIVPRRMKGSNTLSNLISLCESCHKKTQGREELFIDKYHKMIDGKSFRFGYAQHCMQGKTYLRENLLNLYPVELTIGSETANKRIDWDVEKSHSNDAIVIAGMIPDSCDVRDWVIKPMRRQSKSKTNSVLGIKHKDLVSYTYKNGEKHIGYVTALYPELNALNFQSPTKHCKKVNAKKCKFIWRYNKIYWV